MDSEAVIGKEHHAEEPKSAKPFRIGTGMVLFLLAVLVIIAFTVYFRVPLLGYFGFYEPDGYFHFSIIRAAVNNHFSIPQWDRLSGSEIPGVPHHEPFGLYWVTIIPYFFLQYLGISYYTIMRLMPVVFGILDVIGAYFLSRYISKDKLFGLLVMLFIGLNMGNAARTSALIYRGDSFVSFFLIVALIATVEMFRAKDRNMKLAFIGVSAILLSFCNLVWNGAAFATAIYIFAFILMLSLGFTFEKKEMIEDTKYMLGALLVWFLLVALYKIPDWIASVEAFTGLNFFLLFAFMVAAWLLVEDMANRRHLKHDLANTSRGRFALCLITMVVAFVAIYLIIPGFVSDIFTTSGFDITNGFSSTIQELQSPTYTFLWASFGFQNYTNPMSIVMLIATGFGSGFLVPFWLVLMLCFVPYFFMHIENDGEGLASGEASVKFGFNGALLILISFFALTAYLQMNAIRFNSLLSIPMSILSAYTIYWLMRFVKKYRLAYYASYLLLALLVVYMIQTDIGYIANLAPADQINPQFIAALNWLRGNSTSNSVVLTLWPDGSVVEAVANLTSITDSVGSQYAYVANPFAAWLYNSSPDPEFLLSNLSKKPDYLLVRNAWMYETGGIFTESGINVSEGAYGYNPFSSLNEKVNKTEQVYQFFGSGIEEDTVITNGTNETIASYLRLQNGVQPFKYVDFYNQNNGQFSIIQQTAFNITNNQTFLIVYSSTPAPSLYVNITSAFMLNTKLADSNMIKFLYHCNNDVCLWNNKVATMQLVEINPDTKIFHIVYNESNATVRGTSYPRNLP